MEIYDAVFKYSTVADGHICEIFIELPSREDYPDYYEIIQDPLDMNIIRERIEQDRYDTPGDCLVDFVLMFDNAHTYNEEGSVIFNYATLLKVNDVT